MDARDLETSIAEGAQALQALRQLARERAGTLEAHEAETGIFKRRRPIGVAAMKRYFAQRGTGDIGPAIARADGVILPREQTRRGRDYCSLFGTFAGARTCDRMPGEPGICPLDAQVNRPERCDSYVLPEWMTVFAVEHPVKERAGVCAPLGERDVAESVLMEGAKAASGDDAGC
jgi:hypothetical protein